MGNRRWYVDLWYWLCRRNPWWIIAELELENAVMRRALELVDEGTDGGVAMECMIAASLEADHG